MPQFKFRQPKRARQQLPKISSPLSRTGGGSMSPQDFMSLMSKLDLESTIKNRLAPAENETVAKQAAPDQSLTALPGQVLGAAGQEARDIGGGLAALATQLATHPIEGVKTLGHVAYELPGAIASGVKQTLTTNPLETLRTRPVSGISDLTLLFGAVPKVLGKVGVAVGEAAKAGEAAKLAEVGALATEAAPGALETAGRALQTFGDTVERYDPILASLRLSGRVLSSPRTPIIGPIVSKFQAGVEAAGIKREVGRNFAKASEDLGYLHDEYTKLHDELPPAGQKAYESFANQVEATPTEMKAVVRQGYPESFGKLLDLEKKINAYHGYLLSERVPELGTHGLESFRYAPLARDLEIPMTQGQKAAYVASGGSKEVTTFTNDTIVKGIRPNEGQVASLKSAGWDPLIRPNRFLEPATQAEIASKEMAYHNVRKIIEQGVNLGPEGGRGLIASRAEALSRHSADVLNLSKQIDALNEITRRAAKSGKAILVDASDPRVVREGEVMVSKDPNLRVVAPGNLVRGLHLQASLQRDILDRFYTSGRLSEVEKKALVAGLVKNVPEKAGQPNLYRVALEDAVQHSTKDFMEKFSKIPEEMLRGGGDSQLYLIPKDLYDSFLQEHGVFTTHTGPVYTAADALTKAWKISTLALSPAWIVGNAVTSVILGALAGTSPGAYAKVAPHAIANILDSFSKVALGRKVTEFAKDSFKSVLPDSAKWVEERLAASKALIPEELAGAGHAGTTLSQFERGVAQKFPELPPNPLKQPGPLATAIGESYPVKFAQAKIQDIFKFNAAVEDFFRSAEFVDQSAKEAAVRRLKAAGKPFFESLEYMKRAIPGGIDNADLVTMKKLAQDPAFLNKTIPKVEEFLGQFNGLSVVEQVRIKRLIPFYAWAKFINGLFLGLPFKHPLRANLLKNLVEAYNKERQVDPNAPDWLKGSVVAAVSNPGTTGEKLKFMTMRGADVLYGLGRFQLAVAPLLKVPFEYWTGKDILHDFQSFQDPRVFISPLDGKGYRATPQGLEQVTVRPPLLSLILRQFPTERLIEDIVTPALKYSGTGIFDPVVRGEINKEIETLTDRVGQLTLKMGGKPKIQLPEDIDKLTADMQEWGYAMTKLERLKQMRDAGAISVYQKEPFDAVLNAFGIGTYNIYADDLKEMIKKNQTTKVEGVLAKLLADPYHRVKVLEAVNDLLQKQGRLPALGSEVPSKGRMIGQAIRGPLPTPAGGTP